MVKGGWMYTMIQIQMVHVINFGMVAVVKRNRVEVGKKLSASDFSDGPLEKFEIVER